MTSEDEQKTKDRGRLRTSQEVINQLLWDERIDERAFVIGYEERFAGMQEMHLDEFEPNGEIPWHRIWYIRDSRKKVWDRRERLDRLDTDYILAQMPQDDDEKGVIAQGSAGGASEATAATDASAGAQSAQDDPQTELTEDASSQTPPQTAVARALDTTPPKGWSHIPWYRHHLGDGWQSVTAPPEAPEASPTTETPRTPTTPTKSTASKTPQPPTASTASKTPSTASEFSTRSWRVVTWNVLFDLHDADRLYTEERRPAMLAALARCDADIIALQEVTPEFLEALLAQAWVQAAYYVSECLPGKSVQPYGQVLLSRWPLRALHMHAFSPHKRALVAQLGLAQTELLLAVVHLTSDRAKQGAHNRKKQLATLLEYFSSREEQAGGAVFSCGILGDFNVSEDAPLAPLEAWGFADLWRVLHPEAPGYTFIPDENPLAAVTSRTGKARRFDRFLLRAPEEHLSACEASLLGLEPFGVEAEHRYLSDHYGVQFTLEARTETETSQMKTEANTAQTGSEAEGPTEAPARGAEAQAKATSVQTTVLIKPVYRSALIVMPPEELWEPIQAIRAEYDRSFVRWMPHINLVYGFVPDEYFAQAAEAVTQAVAGLSPFSLSLDRFKVFEHRGSSTVWLQPSTPQKGALHALQEAVQGPFPECDEQSKKSDKGFTPHLTVAKFRKKERKQRDQLLATWREGWEALTFTVDHVALISRRDDEPFVVRHRIPLGGAPGSSATHGTKPAGEPTQGGTGKASTFSQKTEARGPSDAKAAHTPDTKASLTLTTTKDASVPSAAEEPTRGPLSLEATLRAAGSYETQEEEARRSRVVQHLQRACRAAIGEADFDAERDFHQLGSVHLGVADAHSDQDLLCVGPAHLPREDFFARLQEALAGSGKLEQERTLDQAVIPVYKLRLEGLHVDILYAQTPPDVARVHPMGLSPKHLQRFSSTDLLSLLGYIEGETLRQIAICQLDLPRFQTTLRAIKLWARRRQVYSNAFGFFGGFTWAILLAALCNSLEETPESLGPEELLAQFFAMYARWDWSEPVGLTPKARRYRPKHKRDRMPVITPCPPYKNSARNLTRSTSTILQEEFARAAACTHNLRPSQEAWDTLFAPAYPQPEATHTLRLTLTAPEREAFAHARGWLEGNVLSLILKLEQHDLFVRPFPVQASPKDARRATSETDQAAKRQGEAGEEATFVLQLQAASRASQRHDATALASAASQVVQEFADQYLAWQTRPEGSTLTCSVQKF